MTIHIDPVSHGPRQQETCSGVELAVILKRHPNTISIWARDGLIPCSRRNKRVMVFELAAVLEAMKRNNLKMGVKNV